MRSLQGTRQIWLVLSGYEKRSLVLGTGFDQTYLTVHRIKSSYHVTPFLKTLVKKKLLQSLHCT